MNNNKGSEGQKPQDGCCGGSAKVQGPSKAGSCSSEKQPNKTATPPPNKPDPNKSGGCGCH